LFVFRSRRGDRLKILVWERDGFLLWYKRLEAGVFKLPKVGEGSRAVELRASELAMILDGIDVSKRKACRATNGAREVATKTAEKNRGTKKEKRKRKKCESKRQFRVCVRL
jgi:transposase